MRPFETIYEAKETTEGCSHRQLYLCYRLFGVFDACTTAFYASQSDKALLQGLALCISRISGHVLSSFGNLSSGFTPKGACIELVLTAMHISFGSRAPLEHDKFRFPNFELVLTA